VILESKEQKAPNDILGHTSTVEKLSKIFAQGHLTYQSTAHRSVALPVPHPTRFNDNAAFQDFFI